MTALLLTNNYPPGRGGVSRYYEGLVSAADGRIHVSGIDTPEGFPPRAGFSGRLSEVAQARSICRARARQYAILAGQPHLAVGAVLAGVPFGLVLHGGEWQDYPMGHRMLVRLLARSRVIGCNSKATRDAWIPSSLHHRVIVIHPGTPCFVLDSAMATSPEPRSSASGTFRVLAVSRLSPRKGLGRLIEAAEICVREGVDMRLDIVGEGPEESRLRGCITLPDRITLHRGLDDASLATLYSQSDLFALLPHRVPGAETWEGFGIVYLEAASKGLPILATRTGGVEEALTPQGSIVLDERCSSKDVARTLKSMIADADALRAMSSANVAWSRTQEWSLRTPLIHEMLDRLESAQP